MAVGAGLCDQVPLQGGDGLREQVGVNNGSGRYAEPPGDHPDRPGLGGAGLCRHGRSGAAHGDANGAPGSDDQDAAGAAGAGRATGLGRADAYCAGGENGGSRPLPSAAGNASNAKNAITVATGTSSAHSGSVRRHELCCTAATLGQAVRAPGRVGHGCGVQRRRSASRVYACLRSVADCRVLAHNTCGARACCG